MDVCPLEGMPLCQKKEKVFVPTKGLKYKHALMQTNGLAFGKSQNPAKLLTFADNTMVDNLRLGHSTGSERFGNGNDGSGVAYLAIL